MLASDFRDEFKRLEISLLFLKAPRGDERIRPWHGPRAVLRECVRVDTLNGLLDHAAEDISKLERYAATSRDLIVESHYESAAGTCSSPRVISEMPRRTGCGFPFAAGSATGNCAR